MTAAPSPPKPFRWGVFGTGAISAKFVAGLATAKDAEIAFVASRSTDKARAFAAGLSVPRAVTGYAEAASQTDVDAVYIATPASVHVSHALMCLEAGIPVLVEKPLALDAAGAAQIATAAKAHGVFAMEAMWTRFLPAAQTMHQRLSTGVLGETRVVTGSFGSSQSPGAGTSMFDPALGGGALSHLAPYPVSLAQWIFGTPTAVQAVGVIGATGVDETVAFQMRYPGDVLGSFHVSIRSWAPDHFHVEGTSGSLRLRGSVVRPHGFDLALEAPLGAETVGFGLKSRLRQHPVVHGVAQRLDRSSRGGSRPHHARYAGNGYHYEADEVRRRIRNGELESPVMPLSDSIAVATTLDTVRAALHPSTTEVLR